MAAYRDALYCERKPMSFDGSTPVPTPAPRGYFAIGAERISKSLNLGNIMRSAHAFGASFTFTVGATYQALEARADTSKGAPSGSSAPTRAAQASAPAPTNPSRTSYKDIFPPNLLVCTADPTPDGRVQQPSMRTAAARSRQHAKGLDVEKLWRSGRASPLPYG